MSDKYDFKKEYRQLYQTKTDPVVIQVPPRKYLCVDGFGDPNTSREYQDAVALLYGITYTIKMSRTEAPAQGYFDYVAPPLEGFWDIDGKGFDGHRITDKERLDILYGGARLCHPPGAEMGCGKAAYQKAGVKSVGSAP